MSKSVSYLFFARNVCLASLLILFITRLSTIFRLVGSDFEFGFLDIIQGFGEDILYLLVIVFPIYIFGRILYTFHEKTAKIFVFSAIALVLFIHIGLNEYFLTVHQIVDSSVFNFSFDELQKTVGLSERFSFLTVIGLLLVIALFIFTYRKLSRSKNSFVLSQHYFALVIMALSWMLLPLYNSNKEVAANELGVESNVSLLLLHSAISYSGKEANSVVKRASFKALDSSFTSGKLEEGEFPLFRTFNQGSALATLMNKSSAQPNIVYVIVEGLSSDFIGDQAKLTGHFMPFLDSLSKVSLYYPNALSTSQRTQNVLPSTLCSVPNVSDGVVFQQMDYPNHYSLQGLLRKQYSTGFYCGVPLEYMNMRGFMNEHSVSRLSGKWLKSVQQDAEKLNSPWGIPDGGLFSQHVSELTKTKHPFFDVLLTISTHDPYVYPEKEKYINRVRENLKGSSSKFKSYILDNAEKFASYAYLDEQLKKYFATIDSATFSNTIVVITGDHGSELWNRSPVSKYHVPILLYSPLLKAPKKVESVVSHLDIVPTLFAYLKQEYQLNLPSKTPFIGQQLLLSEKKAERSFVFTTDQLKVKDVCFKGTFYIDYQLYRAERNFDLKKISNHRLLKEVKHQKELYSFFSDYCLFGNKLVPNEDYAAYYEANDWKELSKEKLTLNRDFDFRQVAKIASLKAHWLNKRKLKIQVQIAVENNRFRSHDSLPDLVMSNSIMKKMERKKSVYRMIRPTLISSTKKQSLYNYVIIFDAAQLAKEKKLKEAHLYLYYKLHNSPKVIASETVISTSK